MKKLNFILKNDDNIICNQNTIFEVVDEMYSFKIDNFDILTKFGKKDFYFKRETEEDVFEVVFNKNNISASVYLKVYNYTFSLNLTNVNYSYCDNAASFSYEIDGEEKSIKSIIISFKN